MGIDITSWRARIGNHTKVSATVLKCTHQPQYRCIIFPKGLFTIMFSFFALSCTSHLMMCMDIQPNPGPLTTTTTATTMIDNSRPPFTKLFNTTKRVQLKLVRYQHHLANYTFFLDNNIMPKGLLLSCTPAFASYNYWFYRKWNYTIYSNAHRRLKLLYTECRHIIKSLQKELSSYKEQLQESCTSETFTFFIDRINSMALSLESTLSHRRVYKGNILLSYKHHYTFNNSNPHNNRNNITIITPPIKRNRRKNKLPCNNTIFKLDTSAVINLSNIQLSEEETSLLARGLTFCPTPKRIVWSEVTADFDDFSRRMRLSEFFHDYPSSSSINPFRNKSSWTPPTDREPALNAFLNAVKHDLTTASPNHITDNLTPPERQAMKRLKQRRDIVIKPADKGSGTVVMDRPWYINECNRQLNNTIFYKPLDTDITNDIQKRITVYVNRMHNDDLIDAKTKQYLIQSNTKPGRFYILPKIHKTGNPGRPIVSSNSHPTERISEFVDHFLKPLVSTLPSYIKDTTDFLNKLLHIDTLPADTILLTLDVSSLYTNIPHNDGINACHHFLDKRTNKAIPTSTLCDLVRMILTMNNFSFNNNHYLQLHGTAMGTKMAPSFANLFLGKFEHNALSQAPYQPHTWLRYIDDIFVIWTEGLDHLKIFVDYLNNLHPTIKFTSSHSYTHVPFLDVTVSLNNGNIETDLFTKPTDKHQHLLYSSCHPLHTKQAIPFSLALRLRRLCSTNETFKLRTNELTTYLTKRGYNRKFIEKQIVRATNISRHDALTNKNKPNSNRIPFIVTYNPALPNISHIIHKHYNILLSSNRCNNVFQSKPLIAHRRCSNLRDLLVKSQLPSNTSNTSLQPGSFRCGKNCATCPYITNGLNHYTFHSTGETRFIKSHITCNSRNLIYMVQCNRCHLQYIGETKRRLKDRFNEHRRLIDKPNLKSNPTAVSEHFLSNPNHSVTDLQLIPLELMISPRDSIRKAREAHLIDKGKTLEPLGLNKRDDL